MSDRRSVSVMGSTGSIGCNALDVIRHANRDGEGGFDVVALTAGSNADMLAEQALEFRPQIAVIADESQLPVLKTKLHGSGIEVAGGNAAVVEAATRSARSWRPLSVRPGWNPHWRRSRPETMLRLPTRKASSAAVG